MVQAVSATMYFGLGLLVTMPFGSHIHDAKRVYRAVMRCDLRNLVTAQEVFFADSGRYAGSLHSLDLTLSTGVRMRVTEAGPAAFAAAALHDADPVQLCTIFAGPVRDTTPGAVEGAPSCLDRPRRDR